MIGHKESGHDGIKWR